MRKKMIMELVVNALLLVIPLFFIIEGIIGLLANNPYHPDVFVLLGLVILGLLSAVMTIIGISRLQAHGWKRLPTYQKVLTLVYPSALLVCILIGCFFYEIYDFFSRFTL